MELTATAAAPTKTVIMAAASAQAEADAEGELAGDGEWLPCLPSTFLHITVNAIFKFQHIAYPLNEAIEFQCQFPHIASHITTSHKKTNGRFEISVSSTYLMC